MGPRHRSSPILLPFIGFARIQIVRRKCSASAIFCSWHLHKANDFLNRFFHCSDIFVTLRCGRIILTQGCYGRRISISRCVPCGFGVPSLGTLTRLKCRLRRLDAPFAERSVCVIRLAANQASYLHSVRSNPFGKSIVRPTLHARTCCSLVLYAHHALRHDALNIPCLHEMTSS